MSQFTKETLRYFDDAFKNRKREGWYAKNESRYQDHVLRPMSSLVERIGIELGDDFPGLEFDPRKISKPTFRKNKVPADGTLVKSEATAFFAEPQTSMFEWNPGIYLSFGRAETVLGLGLYMVSSRQLKRIRQQVTRDPGPVTRILGEKSLRKHWGALQGERYVRFPRDYSPEQPGAEYLWYKQFYLGKTGSPEELVGKTFVPSTLRALRAAAPFLSWVRETVGVYQRLE